MRSLMFALMIVGFIFFAGLGAGIIGGWLSDAGEGPVWLLLLGVGIFLAACGGLYWSYRRIKNKETPDGDVTDVDMIFGDMSDPQQRNIIMRVIIASAIHGIVLMRFIDQDAARVVLGDGDMTTAEWVTIGSFALFALSLIWIVVECIAFHRIDEFWTRIALGPAALAGIGLFLVITFWMVGEEIFGLPQARFWHFYLIYYLMLLGCIIGKWRLGRRRGGI